LAVVGAGLVGAIVLLSRLSIFAPAAGPRAEGESAPAADSRAEGESALEARPLGSIALDAPSAVASAVPPPSAATIAAPGPSASPSVRATPSAMTSSRAVTIGARGACDRYIAFACDGPKSSACPLAKANRASYERSAPAKAEEGCRGLLERDIAARAKEQRDADNLANSPACARYLGAACAPHVLSLPGGSRLCVGVRAFARARAAEGSSGEAACSAAEIGLPAVLQGLARKPEERPIEPPDMHLRFGIGQM
jgi:hypothetical protein